VLGTKVKRRSAESSEALVTLLLPIGRLMLKSGLGIDEMIRAAKKAYVRAAIAYVAPSGRHVSASRLSVMTGLTRKEVGAIVSEISGTATGRFAGMKEQRALRVVRGWRVDPRFCDGRGEPARLSLRGDRRSFSELVKAYGGDVTPNSVLKELERMNVVTFNKSRRLLLRSRGIRVPRSESLSDLARAFPDFADAIGSQHPVSGRSSFFGFRESVLDSTDQAARFQRTFSNRAAILLQGVDQWAASHRQSPRSGVKIPGNKCRVGIGVYLIQGDLISPQILPKARGKGSASSVEALETTQPAS
jgi:Family of unknown function (DUF6502)